MHQPLGKMVVAELEMDVSIMVNFGSRCLKVQDALWLWLTEFSLVVLSISMEVTVIELLELKEQLVALMVEELTSLWIEV